mmetsp:Transcript_61273/g.101978  ORF Transcript_61273/g.101978 Transcript_61273/m.101978 type:complete len:91 (-) Transcript_61273:278-550(-)
MIIACYSFTVHGTWIHSCTSLVYGHERNELCALSSMRFHDALLTGHAATCRSAICFAGAAAMAKLLKFNKMLTILQYKNDVVTKGPLLRP